MRVKIENAGRKRRVLYIDGELAGSARDIYELEAQIRIIKLLSEMENLRGVL